MAIEFNENWETLSLTYAQMPKYTKSVPGMEIIPGDPSHVRGMIAMEDVVYQTVDGIDYHLRIMYPDPIVERDKYPFMLHIQGSGWAVQDLNDHILEYREIAENGIAVAIMEYRHLPRYGFPAQIEDAKTAMHYLMEHHTELKADMDNIFVSGDSSGGHTALMCWSTWDREDFDPVGTPLCPVNAFLDFYGIVNFRTIGEEPSALDHRSRGSMEACFLNAVPSEDPEAADRAGVLGYISETSPDIPLLILHGNKDRWVPFAQSVELFRACQKYHKHARFLCVDDGDHGGSAFYCKRTLDEVIAYLKQHLR